MVKMVLAGAQSVHTIHPKWLRYLPLPRLVLFLHCCLAPSGIAYHIMPAAVPSSQDGRYHYWVLVASDDERGAKKRLAYTGLTLKQGPPPTSGWYDAVQAGSFCGSNTAPCTDRAPSSTTLNALHAMWGAGPRVHLDKGIDCGTDDDRWEFGRKTRNRLGAPGSCVEATATTGCNPEHHCLGCKEDAAVSWDDESNCLACEEGYTFYDGGFHDCTGACRAEEDGQNPFGQTEKPAKKPVGSLTAATTPPLPPSSTSPPSSPLPSSPPLYGGLPQDTRTSMLDFVPESSSHTTHADGVSAVAVGVSVAALLLATLFGVLFVKQYRLRRSAREHLDSDTTVQRLYDEVRALPLAIPFQAACWCLQ